MTESHPIQSSGDPLPSIAEADAVGEIAELYADIRETLNMSFVNLVWRALGAVPGGLKWTWTTMKPMYQSGIAYTEARQLAESLVVPEIQPLPPAALRAVGVDEKSELAIRAALDGYARGNPLNTVTFSSVLVRLRGDTPSTEALPPAEQPPAPSQHGAVPSMMNFDQMDASTAAMVRAVNLLGADEEAAKVQVSLPRNLAHWPGFLSLYWSGLAPYHEDGSLRTAIDAALHEGAVRGRRLAQLLGSTPDPSDLARQGTLDVLENLVPNAMGRMMPVVALLQGMMPAPDHLPHGEQSR